MGFKGGAAAAAGKNHARGTNTDRYTKGEFFVRGQFPSRCFLMTILLTRDTCLSLVSPDKSADLTSRQTAAPEQLHFASFFDVFQFLASSHMSTIIDSTQITD
jgi:hypothetical protein